MVATISTCSNTRCGSGGSHRPQSSSIGFTPRECPTSSRRKWSLPKSLGRKPVGIRVDRSRADYLGGVRSGVAGSPAFFINGELYPGKVGLDKIVAELFKASKRGSTP